MNENGEAHRGQMYADAGTAAVYDCHDHDDDDDDGKDYSTKLFCSGKLREYTTSSNSPSHGHESNEQ